MVCLSIGEVVLGGERVKQSRVPSSKGTDLWGKVVVELSNEESWQSTALSRQASEWHSYVRRRQGEVTQCKVPVR